jgi:hypothetical protein
MVSTLKLIFLSGRSSTLLLNCHPSFRNREQSSTTYGPPGTPERRSAADLQRILDSLIGDTGFILTRDLPNGELVFNARMREGSSGAVLLGYETAHDLTILDPAEYQGLQELCSLHSDLQLGPNELFNFLR